MQPSNNVILYMFITFNVFIIKRTEDYCKIRFLYAIDLLTKLTDRTSSEARLYRALSIRFFIYATKTLKCYFIR